MILKYNWNTTCTLKTILNSSRNFFDPNKFDITSVADLPLSQYRE